MEIGYSLSGGDIAPIPLSKCFGYVDQICCHYIYIILQLIPWSRENGTLINIYNLSLYNTSLGLLQQPALI